MTKPSRNLWSVSMQHMLGESLWILAGTAEKAAKKAVTFVRRVDQIKKPVVTGVKFSGTIDVF